MNKQKIAIIGSGISGLTSAYLLHKHHEIKVFEANDYIGGHTATVDVEVNGREYSIDTGFIVFNDWTYPNFNKLMAQLGVESQPTQMSFSVKNTVTNLEYNGHDLNSLFAQRRNIFNPKFYKMLSDIVRFNKLCKSALEQNEVGNITIAEFAQQHNLGDQFLYNYLLPMGAAIWSASIDDMQDFPLQFFIRFFNNHGLLNITERPQWSVIKGGSRSYVAPLIQGFTDSIELNSEIASVIRTDNGIEIINKGNTEHFDHVIFACHSDQALVLLSDATTQEQQVLGAIPYNANEVVLHTDSSILPKRKLAWASWNYLINADARTNNEERQRAAAVTYNMNILQGIESDTTFCVTLNNTAAINADKILRKFIYHHPVYSLESMQARLQRELICGQNNTHFCGAYWHNGFHEDGVVSALEVCKRFGVSL